MLVFAIKARKVAQGQLSNRVELWMKSDDYSFQEMVHFKQLFSWYFDNNRYNISFTSQAHNEFRSIFLPDKQIVVGSRMELGEFLADKKGILNNDRRNLILTLVNENTKNRNNTEDVILNLRNFDQWCQENLQRTVWYDQKPIKFD
jgi:hypothetical protein